MNKLSPQLRGLLVWLVLGSAGNCTGLATEVEDAGAFKPGEWIAVSDENLDQLRGGFEVAADLTVSFGMVRTVTINGDLVSRSSFNLPDVTKITTEQAQLAKAAMGEFALIQNGAGNIFDPGVTSQPSSGTLIQNSLNDQHIQTLTIINTSVNSLSLFKEMNTQFALKEALLGAIGVR